MNIHGIIEGTIRRNVQSMQMYDWWQAGRVAGTAPTEWDAVQYGRDWAIALYDTGTEVPEAINAGIQATYQYAYADIKDSIVWTRAEGRRCATATSSTDVYSTQLGGWDRTEYDLLDMIARSGMTQEQKKIVVLYAYGYTVADAARELGLGLSSGYRRYHEAMEIMRDTWVATASLN